MATVPRIRASRVPALIGLAALARVPADATIRPGKRIAPNSSRLRTNDALMIAPVSSSTMVQYVPRRVQEKVRRRVGVRPLCAPP